MNKKGYEFNFSWIFAVIIGAVVIAIAIYTVTQLIGTKIQEEETGQAKKIGILLEAMGTNLGSARFASIKVNQKTLLKNECIKTSTPEPFGRQRISTSLLAKSANQKISKYGVASTFRNKYLLSNQTIEANKEFYIASKPVTLPFKVADVLILWGDKESYCFVNAPEKINNEISKWKNIFNVTDINSCPEGSKTVCFSTEICNISVTTNTNTVVKGTESITYLDLSKFDRDNPNAFLYSAIFSDKKTYDCQIERIFGRAKELSGIYIKKSIAQTANGCSSSPALPNSLTTFINNLNYTNQGNILDSAVELKSKNDRLKCRLF